MTIEASFVRQESQPLDHYLFGLALARMERDEIHSIPSFYSFWWHWRWNGGIFGACVVSNDDATANRIAECTVVSICRKFARSFVTRISPIYRNGPEWSCVRSDIGCDKNDTHFVHPMDSVLDCRLSKTRNAPHSKNLRLPPTPTPTPSP
jgi:hypothetical protein